MKIKNKKLLKITILMLLPLLFLSITKAQTIEKPIIICTTSAVGSVVEAFVGETAEVLVLVQPGLCPADFDIKPGYINALSKASLLFKQNIPGEFWLDGLLESAGNPNLTVIAVQGVYNTPEGAKKYILEVGGNLSQILDLDLDSQISKMLNEVDEVSMWMASQARALNVSEVKVICMGWLRNFIESVGFRVVATFNPPETLSAGDLKSLLEIAQNEEVGLIVDNLQIDVEFGEGIASEVDAQHLVLTNFPGAIPGTETLPKMLKHNAEQLFNSTIMWRSTFHLKAENVDLQNQVALFQITTSLAVVIVLVEAVLLFSKRRKL
jgi:ABC-type Zn uptake system ZnuABC Zn-binding protein ZnuA